MENKKAIISVIMPTLNSERTIRMSLESVRKQNFDQDLIEILVIDGGSTDKTLEIAQEFHCIILKNEKKQQEYAKHIGIIESKADYLMFLDSDEVLNNPNAIKNRIDILENTDIKIVITGGYKTPDNFSTINDYINIFSDPFAFYMYGLPSDYSLINKYWNKKYKKNTDKIIYTEYILKDEQLPLIDMCAGITINKKYLKEILGEYINNELVVPKIFYLLIQASYKAALLKDDYILHYSSDSFKKYFKKIKWRIIVNIFYKEIPGTGFSNREEFQNESSKYKKYFFIPYSLTLIIPLFYGVLFSIYRKKIIFLINPFLTFYTGFLICYYSLLKILGIKPKLMIYGK